MPNQVYSGVATKTAVCAVNEHWCVLELLVSETAHEISSGIVCNFLMKKNRIIQMNLGKSG